MPRVKPLGRPLSSDWQETDAVAAALGITPRQLRKLRRSHMTAGTHYRVKNPAAARPEYLWHITRLETLLTPEG